MNCKRLLLTAVLLIQLFWAYSQRNPNNEILVFFNEGMSQEIKSVDGKFVKTAQIQQEKLKSSLTKIGIDDSLIDVALPRFKKEDTLKVFKNGKKIKQPDMTKLFRIKTPKGKKRQDIIDYLNTLPEVLYAEPNGKVVPCIIPNDISFSEQWGLQNTTNLGADIHAEAAWDIYTGNSNNIIAIIDGGTDVNHVDLNAKISGGDSGYGWDGHGIHVSGIAAAESNNSQGVSGVDWHARIHSQRIDNVSDDADTYQAIVDAVNFSQNVHILNNSWALTDEYGNPGRNSSTVRLAFVYAYKANRTSVVAMGNHQLTHPNIVQYPAGFENVIAVGATNIGDEIAVFSVHGNNIDVSAPGVGILSTIAGGGYGNMSGTSMATPFVSGIASLLKGSNANLANDDIENIIKLSADDVNENGFDIAFGFGRVNAERALQYLNAPYTIDQWTITGGNSVSSTGNYQMNVFGVSGLADGTYIVKRYDVQKSVTFSQSFCNIVSAWGRGAFTTGYNLINPNFGEGFCEIVPGTLTNTGTSLRTYVYQIWRTNGSYLGYYPTTPSNVQFAYTVLGILSPTISGPSTVCSSSNTTYTINLPPGATVNWIGSRALSIVSGQGTPSVICQATRNGATHLQAVVTLSTGETIFLIKDIFVGTPEPAILLCPASEYPYFNTHLEYGYVNEDYYLYAYGTNLSNNDADYRWRFYSSDPFELPVLGQGRQIEFSKSTPGDYTVSLQYNGVCGWSDETFETIRFEYNVRFGLLMFPNPATEETTLSIESVGSIAYNEDELWEVEIYSSSMILKEKKNKIRGKEVKIKTNGWKTGIYFVRAKYKDLILEDKLIIK